MDAFEPNDYRKRVLAAVAARGGATAADAFELYDIPLEAVEDIDDATLARRLEEVWAFWQRQRDHPKYGALVADLVADHPQRAVILSSRPNRLALAAQARADRAARLGARFELLDGALAALISRHGGIPAAKRAGLIELGTSTGLTEAEVQARLAAHPAGAEPPSPPPAVDLPEGTRRHVRALLDELGGLWHCPPPVTLFALLEVEPDADEARIALAATAWRARARELAPDRQRTVVDELLAAVADLLERGPDQRARYLDAVALDVRERLLPRLRAAVLVEDRLTAADAELLAGEARALGLDPARARGLPARLAAELGVPAEAPAAPAPAPPGPAAGVRYVKDRRPWEPRLRAARAALRAGQPAQARELTAAALREAGPEPPPALTALRDEIEAVLGASAVPPPADVTARRIGRASVEVRWAPSAAREVTYKVRRRRADGGWHTVGRTAATTLTDGGAPAEEALPVYAVVALAAGRESAAAESG